MLKCVKGLQWTAAKHTEGNIRKHLKPVGLRINAKGDLFYFILLLIILFTFIILLKKDFIFAHQIYFLFILLAFSASFLL